MAGNVARACEMRNAYTVYFHLLCIGPYDLSQFRNSVRNSGWKTLKEEITWETLECIIFMNFKVIQRFRVWPGFIWLGIWPVGGK